MSVISDGNIALSVGDSTILMESDKIQILSGTIEIHGDVVDIKGKPIKLNS